MIDRYLDNEKAVNRLVDVYEKHGKIIVAYDFDDTVYDTHKSGESYEMVIELIRKIRPFAILVVYTASETNRLPWIAQYLKNHDIPFDSINEHPGVVPYNNAKIYYNILLDDRAGLSAAYEQLTAFLDKITEK